MRGAETRRRHTQVVFYINSLIKTNTVMVVVYIGSVASVQPI